MGVKTREGLRTTFSWWKAQSSFSTYSMHSSDTRVADVTPSRKFVLKVHSLTGQIDIISKEFYHSTFRTIFRSSVRDLWVWGRFSRKTLRRKNLAWGCCIKEPMDPVPHTAEIAVTWNSCQMLVLRPFSKPYWRKDKTSWTGTTKGSFPHSPSWNIPPHVLLYVVLVDFLLEADRVPTTESEEYLRLHNCTHSNLQAESVSRCGWGCQINPCVSRLSCRLSEFPYKEVLPCPWNQKGATTMTMTLCSTTLCRTLRISGSSRKAYRRP